MRFIFLHLRMALGHHRHFQVASQYRLHLPIVPGSTYVHQLPLEWWAEGSFQFQIVDSPQSPQRQNHANQFVRMQL